MRRVHGSQEEAASDRRAVDADQRIGRGKGGDTHQIAAGDGPRMTTQQGTIISDDQNTLRADERGPGVLEDFHLREKLFHFDHERIPERVVHARSFGGTGTLRTTSR
jgi:catalase